MGISQKEASATLRSGRTRTVAIATIGNALEFYDFLVFAFFAPSIARTFFPSRDAAAGLLLTFATFGVAYLARPLGAAMLGSYGDRQGRSKAMVLSIGLMTLACLILAVLPPASMIGLAAPLLVVAVRLLQGFSVGGEFGASTDLLLTADPKRSQFFSGQQQTSQMVGVTVALATAAGLGFLLNKAAYEAYGFRIAFMLGAVIGLIGLALRWRPAATSENAPAERSSTPVRELLTKAPGRVLLGCTMLAAGNAGSYIAIYLPTYSASVLHMNMQAGLSAIFVAALLAIPIALGASRAVERMPKLTVMVVSTVVGMLAVWPLFALLQIRRDALTLTIVQVTLTLISAAREVCSPSMLADLFPQKIRITGLSVSYTLGAVLFGAFIPAFNIWLMKRTGSPSVPAFVLIGMGIVSLISFAMIARLNRQSATPNAVVSNTAAA